MRSVEEPGRSMALEIAARTFVSSTPGAPAIVLVGVSHIGEHRLYAGLQSLLEGHDVVLSSDNTDAGNTPTYVFRSGNVVVLRTSSGEATMDLASRLGRILAGGEILALDGELGAGKTTFAKGLAAGLGIDPRDVTSPTFLILHELLGRLPFHHVDAYRVTGADELLELGISESLAGEAVVLVEWAERAPGLLPADRIDLAIGIEGENERSLRFRAGGPRHRDVLDRLAGLLEVHR